MRGQRSRKGKIRLFILYTALVFVIFGMVYLAIRQIRQAVNDSRVKETVPTAWPTVIYTVTPTPSMVEVAVASVSPSPKQEGYVPNTPTPTAVVVNPPFIDASKINERVWENVFSDGDLITINGKRYTADSAGFYEAFISECRGDLCRKIDIGEVGVGDIAYGGKVIALCIGFEYGHPVFMYTGDTNPVQCQYGENLTIFAGYSMADTDSLFCGCVPIPVTAFYDTGYGNANINFAEYAEKWHERYDWDDLYLLHEMAMASAKGDTDRFLMHFYSDEMERDALSWKKGYPKRFLDRFTSVCNADDYAMYSVYPLSVSRIREGEDGHEIADYTVRLLSLDADSFLETSGEWHYMVINNNGIKQVTPHGYMHALRESSSVYGFDIGKNKDADDSSDTMENADEEVEYDTIVIDENSLLVDLKNNGTYVVMSDLSDVASYKAATESACDMYESAGWKVNRKIGAYYVGEWNYNTVDGSIHYKKGDWLSVMDGEKVGFEDERITEMWYWVQNGNIYMYFGKVSSDGFESYWADYFFCVDVNDNIWEYYTDSLEHESWWKPSRFANCRHYFEMAYGDVYFYVDTSNAEPDFFRSDRDTYLFKLVPMGEPKSMYVGWDQDGTVLISNKTGYCHE